MPDTIAERVARGAALLDERRPGWAGEIETRSLDINSCRRCIIGQVFGDFSEPIDDLLASSEIAEHGFYASPPDVHAIEAAWLAAIAARLAPEPAWEPELQEAEPCLTT